MSLKAAIDKTNAETELLRAQQEAGREKERASYRIEVLSTRTWENVLGDMIEVEIRATNLNPDRLARIDVWGSYTELVDGTEQVRVYPSGFILRDNFDNGFRLGKVTPKTPKLDNVLRPNEPQDFKLRFSGRPLDNTETLNLTVTKHTFGNYASIDVSIPFGSVLHEAPPPQP